MSSRAWNNVAISIQLCIQLCNETRLISGVQCRWRWKFSGDNSTTFIAQNPCSYRWRILIATVEFPFDSSQLDSFDFAFMKHQRWKIVQNLTQVTKMVSYFVITNFRLFHCTKLNFEIVKLRNLWFVVRFVCRLSKNLLISNWKDSREFEKFYWRRYSGLLSSFHRSELRENHRDNVARSRKQ